MFSAEEGAFYVSEKVGPILMDQFRNPGVKAGDPIEITKAEVGRGPERRTQWIVTTNESFDANGHPVAGPVVAGALVVPKLPEPPSELEKQLAASIRMVEARKQAQQTPAAPPKWAQTLESQPKHLVDVYAGLVDYASGKHGNAVRADDLRALMTAAFINLSKEGTSSNAA
jgi:hypothetical protein